MQFGPFLLWNLEAAPLVKHSDMDRAVSFLFGVATGVLVILAIERYRETHPESLAALEETIEDRLSRLEEQTQPA